MRTLAVVALVVLVGGSLFWASPAAAGPDGDSACSVGNGSGGTSNEAAQSCSAEKSTCESPSGGGEAEADASTKECSTSSAGQPGQSGSNQSCSPEQPGCKSSSGGQGEPSKPSDESPSTTPRPGGKPSEGPPADKRPSFGRELLDSAGRRIEPCIKGGVEGYKTGKSLGALKGCAKESVRSANQEIRDMGGYKQAMKDIKDFLDQNCKPQKTSDQTHHCTASGSPPPVADAPY